jgi:hypothetical protein
LCRKNEAKSNKIVVVTVTITIISIILTPSIPLPAFWFDRSCRLDDRDDHYTPVRIRRHGARREYISLDPARPASRGRRWTTLCNWTFDLS